MGVGVEGSCRRQLERDSCGYECQDMAQAPSLPLHFHDAEAEHHRSALLAFVFGHFGCIWSLVLIQDLVQFFSHFLP